MKKITKKVLAVVLSFVFVLSAVPVIKPAIVANAANITRGYTTKEEAYNWGSYYDNTNVGTTVQEKETDKWYKFTLGAGKRIYLRSSYSNRMEEATFELFRDNTRVDWKNISDEILESSTGTKFVAFNIDNTTSSTQTYYIHLHRPETSIGVFYFELTMYERIRKGNGTFNFSGTARNSGNPATSSGVNYARTDSTILSRNLTNDTSIPPNAIVSSVRTKGTQSPSQGNVRHKIMPASVGTWYESTVASASSGYFGISADDLIPAKQQWMFCYNVLSPASSTMKNISIEIDWEYDLADTNYELYK